jgi:hypothetical protein
MATGDSADILARVKRLIPSRWFAFVAPLRDGIIGGLADCAAKLYSFIIYARQQTRLATATGIWLDILSYDFLRKNLPRGGFINFGVNQPAPLTDDVYRSVIRATILQERVTRQGMVSAVTTLLNIPPYIFEPWNTNDAGGYRMPNFAYGTIGGWGSLLYPGQVFMKISRAGIGATGVPNVGGWYRGQGGIGVGGYGQGSIEYISSVTAQIGITNDLIYKLIGNTKPSGVTCWVQIGGGFLIGHAFAVVSAFGTSLPFLPIQQAETQPHFIGRYRPATYHRRLPARFN